MKCLVTAGPTSEPLDAVRRLTNVSTGRLGVRLAEFLADHGCSVHLLLSETALYRPSVALTEVASFATTSDLERQIRARGSEEINGVFHVAAVSDYRVSHIQCADLQDEKALQITPGTGKIPTHEGSLWVRLCPTPKILPQLKGWFPHALIVGWKFEVEGDTARAIGLGYHQIEHCSSNACVLNGPGYGPGFGLLTRAGSPRHHLEAEELFQGLFDLLKDPGRAVD